MNHSTPGYDTRGNTTDRRRRREWLVSKFGLACFHCKKPLTKATMQVDRYPVCGHDGGRYVRGNIVPSCGSCNRTRCPMCKGRGNDRPTRLERASWPEEEK